MGEGFGRAVDATFEAAKKLGAAKPAAAVENCGSVGVDLSGPAQEVPESMRAVVLKGVRQIEVEDRPVPTIVDDADMIVKVQLSGLCGRYVCCWLMSWAFSELMSGSDLHLYRGTEDGGTDLIMGHEFTGTVVKIGAKVCNFQIGDVVVSPFTISWYVFLPCVGTSKGFTDDDSETCFYCENGLSSRCKSCMVYGTQSLGGVQAQYGMFLDSVVENFKRES